MTILLIEGGDFLGLVIFIIILMLAPAVIMTIIGFLLRKTKPKASKILFIISVIYTIISLGICGNMMV